MVATASAGLRLPAREIHPARIGPNAILQLVPVLEETGGAALRDRLLKQAGIATLPTGEGMIPQEPAARLHQALREELGPRAADLATEAGSRTADYILAHRIPPTAQSLLRMMPRPLAAHALARAIGKHAWTFAGSGAFRVRDRWHFSLAHNPIVAGERSDAPLCHWHAAVFARLYQRLVDPNVVCRETTCCAMGSPACRFELQA
ncbi:bacteriochlorophyll 4-vinyl reductase [Primorskyibacter sp. S187A]|uniref:bacteriochlorophyll 4-vinyl reductase n=1 Tax=Primorskyibacter sp. S187A TaxID=3415130 RepID=UPI003C7B14A4